MSPKLVWSREEICSTGNRLANVWNLSDEDATENHTVDRFERKLDLSYEVNKDLLKLLAVTPYHCCHSCDLCRWHMSSHFVVLHHSRN